MGSEETPPLPHDRSRYLGVICPTLRSGAVKVVQLGRTVIRPTCPTTPSYRGVGGGAGRFAVDAPPYAPPCG
jgi:hypothetical protein